MHINHHAINHSDQRWMDKSCFTNLYLYHNFNITKQLLFSFLGVRSKWKDVYKSTRISLYLKIPWRFPWSSKSWELGMRILQWRCESSVKSLYVGVGVGGCVGGWVWEDTWVGWCGCGCVWLRRRERSSEAENGKNVWQDELEWGMQWSGWSYVVLRRCWGGVERGSGWCEQYWVLLVVYWMLLDGSAWSGIVINGIGLCWMMFNDWVCSVVMGGGRWWWVASVVCQRRCTQMTGVWTSLTRGELLKWNLWLGGI